MRTKLQLRCVLAGVLSWSSSAGADVFDVDLQLRHPQQQWADTIFALPGDQIEARIMVTWQRTAGAVAWGGVAITQIDIHGNSSDDVLSNFTALHTTGGPFLAQIFGAGTPSANIHRPIGNFMLEFAQFPTGLGGADANPIQIGTFGYTIGASPALPEITFGLDGGTAGHFDLARVFINAAGNSADILGAAKFDGAKIVLFPTPGAAACLLVAGGMPIRRRRP